MSRICHWSKRIRFALVILALSIILPVGPAAATLVWKNDRIDADIDHASLDHLLGLLAAKTGWHIYLEPNIERQISVRFKDLNRAEALKRLLGDLNFALVPDSTGPTKLFVYRTSMKQATHRVKADAASPQAKPIPNELIVTLKPGGISIEELAKRFGAKIIGTAEGLNSYRLKFKDQASADAAREFLASEPDVAQVDSNYHVNRPKPVDQIETTPAQSFPLRPKVTGHSEHVIVGLIDTPVQPLDGSLNDFLLPSIHVAGDPGPPKPELSHGTSMAETILKGLAVAPNEEGGSSVRVLPIDVYGANPETTTFDVARGIYAAMSSGATVINLSMGGDGDSPFLSNLIRDAYRQGVLFFGAAGNQATALPNYPAAYPEVVAVTAGDRRGNIAPYANRGSFVDVIAPGVSIVNFEGQPYMVNGTSAATAYVSGTAAGFRAIGKNPTEAERIIRETLSVTGPLGGGR